MTHSVPRFAFVLLLVTLGACAPRGESSTLPKLTFAQLQPLPVDVETITVKADVPMAQGENPIKHTNVAEAFNSYARQRFVGQGGIGAGTLAITLNEIRVTKQTENTDNQWTAWTHLDQMDSYKVGLTTTLRYDGPNGLYKTAVLKQERGIDIPQRTSLAEREKLEQDMIERLIADLDAQAIAAMQNSLNVMSVR